MIPFFNTDKLRSFVFQNFPFLAQWSLLKRSVTVTVLVLSSYMLLGQISVSSLFDVDLSNTNQVDLIFASILHYGIIGATLGFFYVELLSFVIPKFRQYRKGGREGRRQLTLWSIGVSLLLIVYFSYTLLDFLMPLVDSSGQSVILNAFYWKMPLALLGMVLSGVLACVMAEGITRFGIGNGFCIFLIGNYLISLPTGFFAIYKEYRSINHPPNLVGIFATILIVIYLYQKFWPHTLPLFKSLRPNTLNGEVKDKPISFQLPILPQGIFTFLWPASIHMWPVSILFWIGIFPPSNNFMDQWLNEQSWGYLWGYTVLLVGTSYLGYWMISHPKSIAGNTMGKN